MVKYKIKHVKPTSDDEIQDKTCKLTSDVDIQDKTCKTDFTC